MISLVIILVIVIVGIFIFSSYLIEKEKARKEREKKEYIYQKYGHTDIAERIINKSVWVGETTEQLIDSLGEPIDIDESVLKTKKKEVWKYYQKSSTRYGFKAKVENGIVVGWDEKL